MMHTTAINRIDTYVKVTLFSDIGTTPINIRIITFAGVEQGKLLINSKVHYHTARFEGLDIDNDFTIEQV